MTFSVQPVFPEEFPQTKSDAESWYSRSRWSRFFPEEELVFTVRLLKRKGAKSEETFMGLRGEWERLFLWLAMKEKTVSDVGVEDILEYLEFCSEPPLAWISSVSSRRYNPNGTINENWRPFCVPGLEVNEKSPARSRTRKIKRSRSQSSIARQLSFLNTLFSEMVEEGLISKNPIPKARRESPVIIRTMNEKPPKMFSEDYWSAMFTALETLADNDPEFERPLFIFAIMKSCYLRVSELSERPHWLPQFSDFYYHKGYLFLEVMGKGRKTRSVSVPDALLPYINRYRAFRGIGSVALEMDNSPIVAKERGHGGISQRHLRRIIKSTFEALSEVVEDPFLQKIVLSAASHWMRHTGASLDAVWRSLVDLAKELGHEDPGTTGRTYVHSDMVSRAKSGRSRSIA